MSVWGQAIADVALIVLPLGMYVKWEVAQQNKDLLERIKVLEKRTDERFDINENDATEFTTRLSRDMEGLKERFEDMLKRMDSWESYIRRAKGPG